LSVSPAASDESSDAAASSPSLELLLEELELLLDELELLLEELASAAPPAFPLSSSGNGNAAAAFVADAPLDSELGAALGVVPAPAPAAFDAGGVFGDAGAPLELAGVA
jgi:hypothetical protein